VPKLDDIKKQITQVEQKETTESKVVEELRDPFDLNTFKKVWDEFAGDIKSQGRDFDYNSLIGDLELLSEEKVRLTIANKFQKVALENLKQDLLGHLRSKLKNSFIELEVEIRKIEEGEMRYTNREKFDYLAKKYPKLIDLKDRLDLDPDY